MAERNAQWRHRQCCLNLKTLLRGRRGDPTAAAAQEKRATGAPRHFRSIHKGRAGAPRSSSAYSTLPETRASMTSLRFPGSVMRVGTTGCSSAMGC